jgi:hypothetical protein
VVAERPLRWTLPHRIADGAPSGPVLLRADAPLTSPVVKVVQDGRLLHRAVVPGTVWPSRSVRLSSAWTGDVDPAGGPVVVSLDA